MQIKELSKQTNLTSKTIRYYESIGILPPPQRQENGYRIYDETDVHRLKLVAGARRLDFSLDDIGEILALRDKREAPCHVVLKMLTEKADEINQRITELQCLEIELRELHTLGLTFPTDDIEGKACVCHLITQSPKNQ